MSAEAEPSAPVAVVPVVERFVDDLATPVSAFLKLRASDLGDGPAYLLESAEQGRLGRYSFLGFQPIETLRWKLGDEGDPYAIAGALVDSFDVADHEHLPQFKGGAVGFFGYDLVRTVEDLGDPNPDPLGLPDMALMVASLMLVFDHQRHEVSIVAYAFDRGDGPEAARRDAEALISRAREALAEPIPASPERSAADGDIPFESNLTREEFEANVSRIVEYVHAGVGSGDRARFNPAARDLDERLGRGAGDLEVAKVQEVHVGRRVHRTQAAVDRECLDRYPSREALGGHDLERVARVDVLDDPRGVRLELLAREVRLEINAHRLLRFASGAGGVRLGTRDRRSERLTHPRDQLCVVEALERKGHDRQFVLLVVEGEHQAADHERHVGEPERVGVRV
jgi:hypothetical protein